MSDEVYRERARLVAALASLFPSVLAYNDPAEPEWPLVYVDSPAGQLSWHVAPGDVELFGHVPVVPPDDPRARWDGHTTEEKYDRLAKLTGMGSGLPTPSVVAHPGDTLVIGIDRLLTSEEFDHVAAQFRERLPDVHVVVVDGATSFAVCRPEPERAEPLTSIMDAQVECCRCGATAPVRDLSMNRDELWECDDTRQCEERAAGAT